MTVEIFINYWAGVWYKLSYMGVTTIPLLIVLTLMVRCGLGAIDKSIYKPIDHVKIWCMFVGVGFGLPIWFAYILYAFIPSL